MSKLKPANNDWIYEKRAKLIRFSNITEQQIQDIWIKRGEEYITDFSSLEYNCSAPLYQKMIFRYRNGNKLAVRLWNGCDPFNRRHLLNYFSLLEDTDQDLIEFFSWIANSLGEHQIKDLDGADVTLWKKNNIEFYFLLPLHIQNKLITNYNKDCIKPYNDGFH
jgi:hypothetical protein